MVLWDLMFHKPLPNIVLSYELKYYQMKTSAEQALYGDVRTFIISKTNYCIS